MRIFKRVVFTVLCVLLVSVFCTGVFAAIYLTINVGGEIYYTPQNIEARIWGTYAYNNDGRDGEDVYINFNGAGAAENSIYNVKTEEKSYGNITANIGVVNFTNPTDKLELFIFIKNSSDNRYIIPYVDIEMSEVLSGVEAEYYFDITNVTDPLVSKQSSTDANVFISKIKQQIKSEKSEDWSANMSIDNNDVWLAHIVFGLKDGSVDGSVENIGSEFSVSIGFMSDIQYDSNNILSVKQEQTPSNTSSSWRKIGYNYTLSANATKVENNSLSVLQTNLSNSSTDQYKNADISRGRDDYHNALVYKDIDVVNIDVETGEVIGKLSDVNYPFEWYGRSVTLPAGTKLASGRVLAEETTFDRVDVYTYYPTMYLRRWIVGDWQYMSLSDQEFAGSVKVDGFYTATFETTIFNSDKTIATIDGKVIPRSYVNDYTPYVSGSTNHLQSYYGFKNVDQDGNTISVSNQPNQAEFLKISGNLTTAWQNSELDEQYRQNSGAQGENWRRYVYNVLYTIKYADNNSQATVGYGNSGTYYLYNNKTLQSYAGANFSTVAYLDSEKGGGTIGVYGNGYFGASYVKNEQNEYVLSSTGFDAAGMNYGYNYTEYTYVDYNNVIHKSGLYANQFLTYNNGSDRYLLDGYVGSDKYTSVFCLGMCNPWGNVHTWIFGASVIWDYYDSDDNGVSDSFRGYAYINFDDYDGTNWKVYTASGFDNNSAALENMGYVALSYNLPTTNGYYRSLGVSKVNDHVLAQIVGMPAASSYKVTTATEGLADSYYVSTTESDIFGVLVGGYSSNNNIAGVFSFSVDNVIAASRQYIGLRVTLIS